MRKRRNYIANHAKKGEQDNNDIRNLFRKFVAVKVSEGVSDGTVNQYEENFRFFCEYIESHGALYDVSAITTDFIREWIAHMQFDHIQFRTDKHRKVKDVGLKPSTINTRLKTIRAMFNTLNRERLIDVNPMERISNVSEPEEMIEVLTDKEITRLLGVMDKSYYTVYRDYVLTMFLLDTMLRITEAVTITRNDIDYDAQVVIVRASVAKSRKARAIPVSQRVLRLLNELIKENEHTVISNYIFVTDSGKPYDRNTYNQRLKDYAELASISKSVHPHIFRHTAATRWLENGGGMEELRLILGHSKYEMVKRYAHVSAISLSKAAHKYSLTNQLDF